MRRYGKPCGSHCLFASFGDLRSKIFAVHGVEQPK